MAADRRFRDVLRDVVPWWLSDRHFSSGKTVGFRFLWTMVMVLDVFMQLLFDGLKASWPDFCPPDALEQIGRSRGIARGLSDTDDDYAARLRVWLDKWRHAGSQKQLAIELHEVITGRPKVAVVNRAQHWVIVNTDGSIQTHDGNWDWDSVSDPGRSSFWSEEWVIVYADPWADTGLWGDPRTWGGRDSGLGHQVTRNEVAVIKSILNGWKAAHSGIRAVIWTRNPALFDPFTPTGLPDGTWGEWGTPGTDPRVPSGRNTTECRYWEMF